MLSAHESDRLGHSNADRNDDANGNEHADRYAVADANRYVVSDSDGNDSRDSASAGGQRWVGFGCGPICGHSPSCRDRRVAARRNFDLRVA